MKFNQTERHQLEKVTNRYKSEKQNAWIPISFPVNNIENKPRKAANEQNPKNRKKHAQPRKTWVAWPQL